MLSVDRRALLKASFGVGVLFLPFRSEAAELTGFDALDNAAIAVKDPSSALLEAITRAGDRLVAVGEHGIIIYSDDGGASWVQAEVPVNVTITCVQFANAKAGWAAGHFGAILHTADGGKTWRVQLNGIKVNQLTLAAAQAADTDGDTSPGAPLAMRRANYFVQSGPSKPFLSLIVFNPEKIIAFGAYRMTVMSTDGGKTWVDWSLHIDDRLSHNLYDAKLIGGDIFLAAEAGLVFCSTDEGTNFVALPSPGPVTLLGVLGAKDGSIIVFGVAGTVFRSQDGGHSWSQIMLATQDSITAGYAMASSVMILATEAGSLFTSKDNGLTFNIVAGVSPRSIFDILQEPDGDLICVGASGVSKIPAANLL